MDIRCDGFSVRLSSIIRRVPFPSPLIRACSFQRTDPHIDIRNTEAKCSAFHFRIPVFLTGQLCNRRSLLNIPIIDDIYRNAGCPLACLFTTYSSFSKTSGVFFAVTLYNQYYIFSHHEVEVLVPKGTVAHTYHPIRRVARTSPPYTKRPYSLHVWQYLAVRSRAEGAFRVYYLLIVFLNI